ncbi:DUF6781 family protein [Hydrogenimonas sp.]
MELDIKAFYDKERENTENEDIALKIAVKKAIEAAVHLHHGISSQRLAEEIATALVAELEQIGHTNEQVVQYALENVIDAVQTPKEKEIERLIAKIDRLQRHLNTEEEDLRRSLRELFLGFERAERSFDPQIQKIWQEALENTELQHVEGLGILNETTEAALVTVLEEAEDVEPAIREVIRHITHKALSEGLLSATRVRAILTTILSKAAELAEATPTKAKEIVNGTVGGINDALIAAVKQLKEQLEFAPEEVRKSYTANWDELIGMLSKSDVLYKEIIDRVAAQYSSFIREILQESPQSAGKFAELQRISNETIEIAKKKLAVFAKEAVLKGAEIKEHLASEAKKLGTRTWKRALELAEAYKNRIEK